MAENPSESRFLDLQIESAALDFVNRLLWEMNGYSAGTSDRELILALRRPDEDFCNQVAAISAQWEGAYLKLMTFLAKHPAPVNP
jgi:hypothetical protein